jgi:hypothetical protein
MHRAMAGIQIVVKTAANAREPAPTSPDESRR